MNEGRNAPHPAGNDRCGRSETAHSKDDVRIKPAKNPTAERQAFVEAPDKGENRWRVRRRQRDSREFLETKLHSPLDRERIDFLLGDEEKRLVPAFAQHFSHGETWEEMPARSSTCDHGVHEDVES